MISKPHLYFHLGQWRCHSPSQVYFPEKGKPIKYGTHGHGKLPNIAYFDYMRQVKK